MFSEDRGAGIDSSVPTEDKHFWEWMDGWIMCIVSSSAFFYDAWMCHSFSFMCGLHVVNGLDCLLILGFKKSWSSLISKFLSNPCVIIALND